MYLNTKGRVFPWREQQGKKKAANHQPPPIPPSPVPRPPSPVPSPLGLRARACGQEARAGHAVPRAVGVPRQAAVRAGAAVQVTLVEPQLRHGRGGADEQLLLRGQTDGRGASGPRRTGARARNAARRTVVLTE